MVRGVGFVHDGGSISKGGVAAGALWAVVAGLMFAAWVVMLFLEEHWTIAGMLAATSCATSALAATLQIRTYACRVSTQIRLSAGFERDDVGMGELRPMR